MLLLILSLLATVVSAVFYVGTVKRSTNEGAAGKRANIAAAFWCTVLMVVAFLALQQGARFLGDSMHFMAR